ncbi:MAG: hypothetical protein M3252_04645 [Actinomycetota bacterium]|nr:hypothetical protein [Actinomycetota bacterium]
MTRRTPLVLAGLVAVCISSCQLRMAMDIRTGARGSGTFGLAVALDEELVEVLAEAGVDVLAGLDEVRTAAPDWKIEKEESRDRGLEVRLESSFDDPEEFASLVDSLDDALAEDDARLYDDLRLEPREDGTVAFKGRIGLLLPTAPGARGAGVAFDADDLQRLLATRGQDLVRYELRVTLPAPPREHDADEVRGSSVVWRAPIGEFRAVSAVSGVPSRSTLLIFAIAALVAAAVTALLVTAFHRRWLPPWTRERAQRAARGRAR